jgi:UDP-N-acetylmuramoyl-L-alanyl-D-glutamate--2,6-diaminopimelate ligase
MSGVSATRPVPAAFDWAQDLFTYGVTGTNGKTSTCALLAACLRAAGRHVLLIGTTGAYLDDREIPKGKSFADFCAMVKQGADAGCRDVVIETTSFGLQNGYAQRWRFDLGVFTNLSPDHLKTHGTWENYLAAKAQLFLHLGAGRTMVLNAADQYATFIDRATPADVRRLWFRVPARGPAHHPADLEAAAVHVSLEGTTIELAPSPMADALGGTLRIPMIGEVFAENALAAAAAAYATGLPPAAIVAGLAACPVVPGRFEVLGRKPAAVVDYAHTPDALTRTCATARSLVPGRVIVVFGASGGSTPEKRGPMGAAVASGCDLAIVTSDNPRHEDPATIAEAVRLGAVEVAGAEVVVQLDRRAAIEFALQQAGPGDIVVVAGMGHERGQRVGGRVLPFSDRDEVSRVVARR